MDLGAQIIAIVVSIGFKVPIMTFAAVLLLRMYRAAHPVPPKKLWLLVPEESRLQFRLLHWSLVAFFFSEIFCGIETWILLQSNPVQRALHGVSSALGMGLLGAGMCLLVDQKLIHYGKARCALNQICQGCTIRDGGNCKLSPAALLAATFLLFAAIPPLFASTEIMLADPTSFITPFDSLNHWYDETLIPLVMSLQPDYKPIGVAFYLPRSTQIIDYRIIPGVAAVVTCLGIALLYAQAPDTKRRGLCTVAFAAGLLCYTYFELTLHRGTGDLFIGALGHEAGELFFLVLLAEILTRTFPPRPGASPADGADLTPEPLPPGGTP
ncbi:hypothetical protein ACFL59_03625 [Planctomycetota bacterium]